MKFGGQTLGRTLGRPPGGPRWIDPGVSAMSKYAARTKDPSASLSLTSARDRPKGGIFGRLQEDRPIGVGKGKSRTAPANNRSADRGDNSCRERGRVQKGKRGAPGALKRVFDAPKETSLSHIRGQVSIRKSRTCKKKERPVVKRAESRIQQFGAKAKVILTQPAGATNEGEYRRSFKKKKTRGRRIQYGVWLKT